MIQSKVLNEETALLMANWARWARSLENYARLWWYPRESISFKEAQSTNVWEPENHMPIRNADAERIENAVVKLRAANMQLGLCIKYRWVYEFKGKRLAKELGCNKQNVYQLTDQAELTLQGIIWGSK